MKLQKNTTTNRLGGYLTAAVTCGSLASTANAAVINLDVSSITGPNAGVSDGSQLSVTLYSLDPDTRLTGSMHLNNNFQGSDLLWGIDANDNMRIAITGGDSRPRNFAAGSLINNTAIFSFNAGATSFRSIDFYSSESVSPDFGANSFIGFRSANNHYGYLEVTWTSATNTFEILSGAYEDQPGVGITTPAAIPEPSTAVLSLGALAAGAFIRRRKQVA